MAVLQCCHSQAYLEYTWYQRPKPESDGKVLEKWLLGSIMTTYDDICRKVKLEGIDTLQIFDLLIGERNVESLSVLHEVLDLPPSNERKDICCLLHKVGDRHYAR